MRLYLDQSGKWEESGPTAIGISDEKSFRLSLYVDAQTKRTTERHFRERNSLKKKSKTAVQVRCFAYLVFLALRKTFREGDELVLDREYESHDQRIREILVHLFKNLERRNIATDQISFTQVGKALLCHKVALQAFCDNRTANVRIRFEQLKALMEPVTKR